MNAAPEKIKKKRGRKPKNIISKQTLTDTQVVPENLIINVKAPTIQDSVAPYETTISSHQPISEEHFNSSVCWNCCESVHDQKGTPVNYVNGVYMMMGTFCSYGCCARYIHDTYDNSELWKRYNLLNMYYNETMNTQGERVQMAPHKHLLKEFGGYLTREEYHSSQNTLHQNIMVMPPIIPLENTFLNLETHPNNPTGNLKLYRKTPIKKNKILQKLEATS
jgi:hypothetical protein